MSILLYSLTVSNKILMKWWQIYGQIAEQEIMKRQNVINPYHTTGLFLYPLKYPHLFSRCIERDQWHDMG